MSARSFCALKFPLAADTAALAHREARDDGALVAEVLRGGPAQKAGLQPYDIIIDVNGHKIGNSTELQNTIAGLDIGSKAKVRLWRFNDAGKRSEKTIAVSIAELTMFAMQAQEETSHGVEIYLAVTALYVVSAFAVNRLLLALEQHWRLPGTAT